MFWLPDTVYKKYLIQKIIVREFACFSLAWEGKLHQYQPLEKLVGSTILEKIMATEKQQQPATCVYSLLNGHNCPPHWGLIAGKYCFPLFLVMKDKFG